jgi:type VI secretion system protein ImpM
VTSSNGGPIVIGKVPAAGDFVRLGAGEPGAVGFFDWLEAATAESLRARVPLPPKPLAFLQAAGGGEVLTGVLVGSRDRVGREFPLAIFHRLPAAWATAAPLGLVALELPFFAEAAALLEAAAALDGPTLLERARVLPAPSEAALARAEAEVRALLAQTSFSTLQRVLPQALGPGRAPFALETSLAAAEAAGRGGGALVAPAPDLGARALWAGLLGGSGDAARISWIGAAGGGQLLLAVGPLPATALLAIAAPERAGGRVWSVVTERSEALAAAEAALRPGLRQALAQPDLSIAALLAGGGRG